MSRPWYTLDMNIKTLEADTVRIKLYNDIVFIREWLVDKGYSPSSLQSSYAYYNTPINQVRNELQKIEDNIDVINSVDTIVSIYYDQHKTIGSTFTLEDYQRWVLILNDLLSTYRKNRRWAKLRLSDCIPTIDGKEITIRGDEIGS